MTAPHPNWQRIDHRQRIRRRPPRHTAFGAALKAARETADLSQLALTNRAGVSQGLVSRWETGQREPGLCSACAGEAELARAV